MALRSCNRGLGDGLVGHTQGRRERLSAPRATARRCRRLSVEKLWDVLRSLAGAKLDDAELREPLSHEWIFTHQGLHAFSIEAHDENDAAVPRNFASGD